MPIHPDWLQSVLPFCIKSHSHVSIHVVCSAIIRQFLGPTSVISAPLSTSHASVPLISQIFNPIYPSLFLIYWHSISVFRDLRCIDSPRLDLACKFGNLSVEFILSKWVVVGMFVFWASAFLFFLRFLQPAAARGSGFVKTEGTHFSVNGYPLFVNGFNSYWLMTVATDSTQRNKVTSAFEQAAAHGLNVARTWAFNDGQYKALQTSPGVYDEQVFQVCAWALAIRQSFNPSTIFLVFGCLNMLPLLVFLNLVDVLVFSVLWWRLWTLWSLKPRSMVSD